jgi:hypothetical protein
MAELPHCTVAPLAEHDVENDDDTVDLANVELTPQVSKRKYMSDGCCWKP